VFTATLRKSGRNLQVCSEAGLLELLLERLPRAAPLVVDLLVDLMGALAAYSVDVRELKALFGAMKAVKGKWVRGERVNFLPINGESANRRPGWLSLVGASLSARLPRLVEGKAGEGRGVAGDDCVNICTGRERARERE